MLQRIKEAGLTINREKNVFGKTEVKYLGVLVNRDGFRPDPDKIEPVISFPVFQNLKQLRRFMGMASWYRKFLKDIATIAEPLTALTKKDRRYEYLEGIGVYHSSTPPYHPQANPVERVSKTLKTRLTVFAENSHAE